MTDEQKAAEEAAALEAENTPLDQLPIVYPRWIHHFVRAAVYVQSEEQAAPYYAEGFKPWPIVEKPTDADIVKVKVADLEKQIEELLGGLSDEVAKRVMQEIYGDIKDSGGTGKKKRARDTISS